MHRWKDGRMDGLTDGRYFGGICPRCALAFRCDSIIICSDPQASFLSAFAFRLGEFSGYCYFTDRHTGGIIAWSRYVVKLCLVYAHVFFSQFLPVMGEIVFLKIVFYFKTENTILFSIFKIVLKSIL